MTHIEKLRGLEPNDRFKYLMELDYETLYKDKNGQVIFYIKKLGLSAKGNDALEAQRNLKKAKEAYFADIIEFNLLEQLKLPEYEGVLGFDVPKQVVIAGKYTALGLFYLAVFALGAGIFASKMERTGSKLAVKVEKALNPSEDEMKRRIMTFRDKLDLLLPYIQEIEKFRKENDL